MKIKSKKPPYRVPSMKDVAKVRGTNGLKMVSTFSGCGGSCLGFEMAGYNVVWANEFVKEARDSYIPNHPGVILDDRDIREVNATDILKAIGLKKGELDVFDGSPPCQSFSTAGKREKGWGKVSKHGDGSHQRADDLFFEYARLLQGLKPKVFVAENVSGLVKGTAKGYFKLILAELKAAGYRVKALLLDAQWLGVPQARKRIIFIGVRNDLKIDPVFPKPLKYQYAVANVCPEILSMDRKGHGWFPGGEIDLTNRSAPTVGASPNFAGYSGHVVTCKENIKRKFTIAELKRICAFPDDFILKGSYAQQWARLGNSVPPLMMRAVAETLRDQVFSKL